METLGERLKALREAKGLSMNELSQISKIAVSALSYFERNQRSPSADALVKLANSLNVSTDFILGQVDTDDDSALTQGVEYQKLYRRLKSMPVDKQNNALRVFNNIIDGNIAGED